LRVDDDRDSKTPGVRFGLIGAGRWGACHASAIANTAGARLAAVATSNVESARRAGEEFGVPAYASWEAMLADSEKLGLSAVDIVAPNVLHAPIATAALNSNLHVLVEKPMATTLEGCTSILDAAVSNARSVAVGHELRMSSLWGTVKRTIDEGRIGEPRAMTTTLFRRSFRSGSGGWRHDRARVGSWLLEEPVHFLDLARWYFSTAGDPVSVYAKASGPAGGLHENFLAVLEFGTDGYAAVAQTLAGAEHHVVAEIIGTAGAVRVTWSGESDRSRTPQCRAILASNDIAEDLRLPEIPSEEEALQREIANMVASVNGGEEPVTTAHDGLWAVMMALAAEESALAGRPVALRTP
jgi:myo-inositol 2-dehydrogenase / D-chiro-inositol 1-dehydrogenase